MKSPTTNLTFQILLIEDNEDHAELVKRNLEEYHIPNQIHHLTDGAEAIQYLENLLTSSSIRESGPDLILLDLKLPKVNGHEILAFLKENQRLRRIPVVILTSSGAMHDIQLAYQNHVNSYLVKPIAFVEFNDLLHDVGNYWIQRNTLPEG